MIGINGATWSNCYLIRAALLDAAFRKFAVDSYSTTVTPSAKPSSAVLLIVKAFAIGFSLVVGVSLMTGVIMDLMGL